MTLEERFKNKYGDKEVTFPKAILTIYDNYPSSFSSGSSGYITKARYNNNTIELYHDWWAYGWFPYNELQKKHPKAVKEALNYIKKLI